MITSSPPSLPILLNGKSTNLQTPCSLNLSGLDSVCVSVGRESGDEVPGCILNFRRGKIAIDRKLWQCELTSPEEEFLLRLSCFLQLPISPETTPPTEKIVAEGRGDLMPDDDGVIVLDANDYYLTLEPEGENWQEVGFPITITPNLKGIRCRYRRRVDIVAEDNWGIPIDADIRFPGLEMPLRSLKTPVSLYALPEVEYDVRLDTPDARETDGTVSAQKSRYRFVLPGTMRKMPLLITDSAGTTLPGTEAALFFRDRTLRTTMAKDNGTLTLPVPGDDWLVRVHRDGFKPVYITMEDFPRKMKKQGVHYTITLSPL